MKKILTIFLLLTIFSCENKNNREYIVVETFKSEKWIKVDGRSRKIMFGSDGHEYIINYCGDEHYVDCNLCLSRLNKKS